MRAPLASGSKAPTIMPESVCMQATPSMTEVFMVAIPRPISRSGKMPRPWVITMVLEALKNPIATMAPMGSQVGASAGDRERGKKADDDQASGDSDPLAGVEHAVERAE